VEFAQRVFDVKPGCAFSDDQRHSDLAIGVALGNQQRDLALAPCQGVSIASTADSP
jgi:hypothetical protein